MKKEVFPKEILDQSVEVHQFSHSTKSKIIYSLIISFIIIALAALPFLYVDVYVSARGIIVPEEKRMSLTSMQSGKVKFINMTNNQFVKKGDTLVIIEDPVFDEKWRLLSAQIERTQLFVSDLDILLGARSDTKKIKSSEYKAAYALYTQGLYDLKLKQEKATRDFERNNTLYEKGVISKVAFEDYQHQRNITNNTVKQWIRRHANQWEAELSDYEQTLVELESAQKQLSNNEGRNVLVAPIAGTLLDTKGLQTNSVVQAGQQIAELSPKGKLVVECYIAPSDIGYLQHKAPVNFNVDAFNYNQWGVANGSVISIADDIELMDGNPVFKLRCSMDTPTLKLKNGVEGRLKKGMTLTAQFILTRRSLFDLLYDKVDDWLNPAQKIKS